MARKLFVMLAATVLTVMPLSVNALGFGNIRVTSALNERMDAEIDLLGATANDVKDLKVGLATQNAFLRAGIDRSAPLLGLSFSVKRHSNGTYYIKMTSSDNIREPFLNFLLEMNWKNGRMLREYTVLLDPPDRMQRQSTVVATPQTQAPASIAKEEKMAAAKQESPFIPAPVPAPIVKPEPTQQVDDGKPFPSIPLTEYKDKDAQAAESQTPEVAEVKPEPVKPAPAMEPLIPEPEKATPTEQATAADSAAPMAQDEQKTAAKTEEQPFEDVDQLYPTIPLSAYTDVAATDQTGGSTAPAPAAATGSLDYGITQKGDRLWTIAAKLRKNKSVTIDQVMMALLKSNPAAFVKGNVHRMKVGQVLRIEDPSLLTAMSAKQAAQEYATQTQAWEEYRQQVAAAKTAAQPEMASDAGQQTPAETQQANTPEGELVLSAPEAPDLTAGVGTAQGKAAKTSKSDADLLREEVRKTLAQAKTEQGQNTALNEHLRELEGEVSNLQRSMTVKDDELAALQQQLSAINKSKASVADETAADSTAATDTATPENESPAKETPPVETSPPQAAMAPETPATPETPAGDLTAQSGLAAKPEAQPTPPIAPVQVTPPEPGFMDKAIATLGGVIAAAGGALSTFSIAPLYLGVIGAAVVLLIILTIILLKRRKTADNFQESILSGAAVETASESAPVSAAEPASLDTNFSEESSFLSDFAISGAGAIQTEDSEVDPLTEADVFMAYGRHEAAEERLVEAIKQDPNRKELKLKLLELYNTTKNRDSFEPLAEEFYAGMGESADGDPMWEKVLVMGAEIAADNPLFSNAPTASLHQTEEDFSDVSNASLSDSQVMDIGLDTGVFQTSDFDALDGSPASSAAPEDESSGALDFNLDFGESDATADESTASLDFNLGDDDEDTATLDAPSSLPDATEAESEEDKPTEMDLDFNFDSSMESDNNEPTMSMKAPDLDESDMSLDFDMGEAASESTPSIDLDMTEETPAQAPADEEFSLDLGAEETAGGLDLNLDATDASTDMDDVGAVDEVGTKLDLAKAYIDMGDPEGARSILDEVMEEGNSSQKQEAQQLIQQIV